MGGLGILLVGCGFGIFLGGDVGLGFVVFLRWCRLWFFRGLLRSRNSDMLWGVGLVCFRQLIHHVEDPTFLTAWGFALCWAQGAGFYGGVEG